MAFRIGIGLIFFCLISFSLMGKASERKPVSDQNPLIVILTDGLPFASLKKSQGIFVEMFAEIQNELDIPIQVVTLPWKRGLKQLAQAKHPTVLINLVRTVKREKHYDWLSPLIVSYSQFASLGPEKLTPDLAKKKQRALVKKGTIYEAYLRQEGYENIMALNASVCQLSAMVEYGRGDFVFSGHGLLTSCLEEAKLDRLVLSDKVHAITTYMVSKWSLTSDQRTKLTNAVQAYVKTDAFKNLLIKYNYSSKNKADEQ
ncbi:transporter substrate-binding domain-containing protein [Temperatibacter marinus]|uniref:Transporter substrate-binding domain-containing protein n=1 Tax=Temperatibacter marinus TaxID=1456591 RepID=A0AA52HBQ6_9PROT|nr:transporter substrate-binding domain-containing protein [Temperatibacter marinus]WND03893.1 transporter substrate-binding domain-containing protein [Temperatibacter marinus]